jgi:hypothetical protein
MAITLAKGEDGNPERRLLEIWVGSDGNVEPDAYIHPTLTRPGEGVMPAQKARVAMKFTLPASLLTPLKNAQQTAVDTELAK